MQSERDLAEGVGNYIENLISHLKRHGVGAGLDAIELLTTDEAQRKASKNNLRSRIYAKNVFNRDEFIDSLADEIAGRDSRMDLKRTKLDWSADQEA